MKCFSLNTAASNITNKLIAKLSANLMIGQPVSIITSSAIIELTKLSSSNISNVIKKGESGFNLPSFCSMTNQLNNCPNKILISQV